MHLRVAEDGSEPQLHAVQLRALDLTVEFEPGETILTEISRKFDLNTMQQKLQAQGLIPLKSGLTRNSGLVVALPTATIGVN